MTLLIAGACASSSSAPATGSAGAATGRRFVSGTGAGSSVGSATTAGGGTASASTGSSSSSTGGGSTTGCGQIALQGNVVNLCTGAPATGLAVTDALDSAIATSTDSSGDFDLCVAPGTLLGLQLAAKGYPNSQLEYLQANASGTIPRVPLICDAYYGNVATANLSPPLITSDAQLMVFTHSKAGAPGCSDVSGWSFSLQLPDGGTLASSAVAVTGSGSVDPGASGTDASGLMFLYDIDPSVPLAQLIGVKAGNVHLPRELALAREVRAEEPAVAQHILS